LTLIELIVVLVILVGLGALLVPVIGNAITRTHLSTCLTNFPEVSKMLIAANTRTGSYGDGWTIPIDISDAPAAGFVAGDYGAITTDEIAALSAAGLNLFTRLDATEADYNVTFNNGVLPIGAGGNEAALTDGDLVPVLSPADAANVFLRTDNGQRYVFFAIDKSWTGIGSLCPEPPVHFGDTPGALPDEVYSRFGAIFQVADAGGTLPIAQFKKVSVHIGVAGLGGSYETADAHSAVYWDEVDEQQ
jgi:type II secretory pathway pseudopilin PulG